jgi:hypothetical protein
MTAIQTSAIAGAMACEYALSGGQNPCLAHVVPPARTSTTAATPTPKNPFEMTPARQSPNALDMTNIASGNKMITKPAQWTSFSPT